VRLFVALDLPDAVRTELAAWADRVAPAGVRRVPCENLHLTLAFLGTRSPEDAAAVGEGLPGLVDAHPPGELATAGALWLPPRRPRVLTVALAACADLVALHAVVVGGLAGAIGHVPEERPFRPHVTVGRVPRGASVRAVALDPPPASEFHAEAVTLYRSHTGAGGARYEPLVRVPFV